MLKLKGLLRGLRPLGIVFGLLVIPAVAQAEGPAFKIDPLWPKDMRNNWTMGQVGGISIDEQDHIWVLQRPRSLTAAEAAAIPAKPGDKPTSPICCKPAPSVLEFDQAGNLLAAWGGPASTDLGQVDCTTASPSRVPRPTSSATTGRPPSAASWCVTASSTSAAMARTTG